MLDVPVDLSDGDVEIGLSTLPGARCDYLLFVVTETEEAQMKAAAQARSIRCELKQSPMGEYHDLGTVGSSRLCLVRIKEGPLHHRGSAAQAIYWKTWTGADGVIAVGMAFAVDRERQRHRDVLVSTHLLAYDQRVIESKDEMPFTRYPDVQALPANRGLLAMLDREIERRKLLDLPSPGTFRVHRGALLSGAARIHSRTYRAHLFAALASRGQPIVGGEMEGAGLLGVEARAAWLVAKGIIDFADEHRDEEAKKYREEACRNAAGLVLDAFLHKPIEAPMIEKPMEAA